MSAGLSRFASGTALVLYVASVRLILYATAGPHYGYFRDELYYLACGEHPAWGYVDQPPLIAWLAGLLTRELGGRCWAMFLASLAAMAAPISLALSHLFTMNAFDPLLWTAIRRRLLLPPPQSPDPAITRCRPTPRR